MNIEKWLAEAIFGAALIILGIVGYFFRKQLREEIRSWLSINELEKKVNHPLDDNDLDTAKGQIVSELDKIKDRFQKDGDELKGRIDKLESRLASTARLEVEEIQICQEGVCWGRVGKRWHPFCPSCQAENQYRPMLVTHYDYVEFPHYDLKCPREGCNSQVDIQVSRYADYISGKF